MGVLLAARGGFTLSLARFQQSLEEYGHFFFRLLVTISPGDLHAVLPCGRCSICQPRQLTLLAKFPPRGSKFGVQPYRAFRVFHRGLISSFPQQQPGQGKAQHGTVAPGCNEPFDTVTVQWYISC